MSGLLFSALFATGSDPIACDDQAVNFSNAYREKIFISNFNKLIDRWQESKKQLLNNGKELDSIIADRCHWPKVKAQAWFEQAGSG